MCLDELSAILKATSSDVWANQLRIFLSESEAAPNEQIKHELEITRFAHTWQDVPDSETSAYRCQQESQEYFAEFEDDMLTLMCEDLEVYFKPDGSEML